MAIPEWYILTWKKVVPQLVLGVSGAFVCYNALFYSKHFGLDTYKGRSELYRHRKIPPGADPWRY